MVVSNYTNQFQNSLEEMTDLDTDIHPQPKSKEKIVTKEKDLET